MKVRYSRVSTQVAKPPRKQFVPKVNKDVTKDKKPQRDVVFYNQRIASAAKDKNLSYALSQWDAIESEGLIPTAHTYCAMINALVRCGQLSRAETTLKTMEQRIPLNQNTREGYLVTMTALLKGYFMSSEFDRSHELFAKIERTARPSSKVNSRTLDTYLRGCLRTGAFEEGVRAFESPFTEKSDMSNIYISKMYAIRLQPKTAASIGNVSDASVCIHIASAYVRLGKLARAKEWFEKARGLLFSSCPERQFDKLQKSEGLRICDFFTAEGDNYPDSENTSLPPMIQQFLVISLPDSDSTAQSKAWESLGISKFQSDNLRSSPASLASALTDDTTCLLEVCSGSGEWICREAQLNRDKIYIASEFRFDRCVDILTRKMFLNLTNLWIVCGDVRHILNVVPKHAIDQVHVNYPEPPPGNVADIEEAMSSDVVTKKFLIEIVQAGLAKNDSSTLHIVSDDKQYMQSLGYLVSDVYRTQAFPKASKTLVDSYFARFFSKKAKRHEIVVKIPPRE